MLSTTKEHISDWFYMNVSTSTWVVSILFSITSHLHILSHTHLHTPHSPPHTTRTSTHLHTPQPTPHTPPHTSLTPHTPPYTSHTPGRTASTDKEADFSGAQQILQSGVQTIVQLFNDTQPVRRGTYHVWEVWPTLIKGGATD